jgi:hypothetical protein
LFSSRRRPVGLAGVNDDDRALVRALHADAAHRLRAAPVVPDEDGQIQQLRGLGLKFVDQLT